MKTASDRRADRRTQMDRFTSCPAPPLRASVAIPADVHLPCPTFFELAEGLCSDTGPIRGCGAALSCTKTRVCVRLQKKQRPQVQKERFACACRRAHVWGVLAGCSMIKAYLSKFPISSSAVCKLAENACFSVLEDLFVSADARKPAFLYTERPGFLQVHANPHFCTRSG